MKNLSFENKQFKIVVISDIQDKVNVSKRSLKFIDKVLDSEKPNLVVLNGDNIFGLSPSMFISKNIKKTIDQFLEPIVKRNIPFSLVFGNHDADAVMSKEKQLKYYQSFKGCLASKGNVTGVGNYNLLINGKDNIPKLNLWFFDSGNLAFKPKFGYNYVRSDQIKWYEQTEEKLKKENNNKSIPSIVFQHIPVPEVCRLLLDVPKNTPKAIRGYSTEKGKYFIANPKLITFGTLNEKPCTPSFNNGQFDAFKKQGDVMVALFGHDHVNDFRGKIDGIELVHVPGVGFYSYGNGYKRGITVLEFNENDIKNYRIKNIYYEDLFKEGISKKLHYSGEMIYDISFYILAIIILLLIFLFLFAGFH